MWLFFIVSLCTTFHVVTAFCQLHNKRICYVMLWLFWWIKSAEEIGILHWRQIAFSRCSYIDDCWCCEGGEQADWPQAWRCVPQVIVCRQKTTQPVTFRFLSVGSFFFIYCLKCYETTSLQKLCMAVHFYCVKRSAFVFNVQIHICWCFWITLSVF